MYFILAAISFVIWELGRVFGIMFGGSIDLFLVVAIALLITRLVMGPTEKKVKIQSEADPEALAQAQQQIRDLQEALRFYVNRSDEASAQLELAVARAEMFKRHRAEIVERVEGIFHMGRWIQGDRDTAEAEVVRLNEMVERLRAVWAKAGKTAARRFDDLLKADQEIEQLKIQMAGISVAAAGGVYEPAERGSYGWSVPYQDVLNLRDKYDGLDAAIFDIRTSTIDAKDPAASFYRLRSRAANALSDGE